MKTTYLFLAVSLLFLCQLLPAQTLPTEGLVGYYPFNGDATDESGNTHHGTVYGATPTTDRFGNPNSAYYFDGVDDYLILPPNILTDQDSVFTITFWYKSELDSGMIITDRNNDNMYPYFYDRLYFINCSESYRDCGINDSFSGYARYYSNSGENRTYGLADHVKFYPQHDKWTFRSIYFNYNNNDRSIQNSGILYYLERYRGIKSICIGKDISTKPIYSLFSGSENSTYSVSPFKGIIDDIRFYNRILTDTEREKLKNDTLLDTNNQKHNVYVNDIFVSYDSQTLKITSSSQQDIAVSLYSIEGKKIQDLAGNNQYAISGLPKGLYWVMSTLPLSQHVHIQKALVY